MQTQAPPQTAPNKRLASLDQFRGYTVLGMLLVNYFGGYSACPQILRHTHDYCSYADTIMPHFLFAVGFAMRLTFGRYVEKVGSSAATIRIVRRLLGLVLVSLVVYTVSPRAANWEELTQLGFWGALQEPLKRSWFQTLMHIAVTSLWILPVLLSSARIRVIWLTISAIAHLLLSLWFNFEWVNTAPNGIDGGPLGFLTWSIPALVGTLACDAFAPTGDRSIKPAAVAKAIFAAALLMMLGYVMSCGTRLYDVAPDAVLSLKENKLASDPVWPTPERFAAKQAASNVNAWLAEPPFVKPPDATQRKWNYWMMSQRGGTISYLTFSAGFSLFVFVVFYVAADGFGLRLAIFQTFGTNALLAYIVHSMVSSAVQPFFPKDSPAWYAITGLILFFSVNWLIVRNFEKQEVFLRV